MPKKPDEEAQRALKTLKADLKNHTPRNLYLFHGEEVYLRDHYLSRLKSEVLPAGAETFNLKTLDGGIAALDILKAADCLPMMCERTLVLVKDFDIFKAPESDKLELISLFEDLPDYLCLVFLYDLIPYKPDGRAKLAAVLKEKGLTVEFARQTQGDLNDWISRHFKHTGHDIDTRTAEFLTFYCGDLMTNLSTEIAKIAAYAKGKRITKEDIEAVAAPQPDAKIYELTDAVAGKNFDKALGVLSELFQMQEPPQMLLSSLGKYMRQLYAARVALETRRGAEALAALWKMKPYPASKLLSAAQRVSMDWCKRALSKTAAADLALKSGGDDQALLTQLVLELAYG